MCIDPKTQAGWGLNHLKEFPSNKLVHPGSSRVEQIEVSVTSLGTLWDTVHIYIKSKACSVNNGVLRVSAAERSGV